MKTISKLLVIILLTSAVLSSLCCKAGVAVMPICTTDGIALLAFDNNGIPTPDKNQGSGSSTCLWCLYDKVMHSAIALAALMWVLYRLHFTSLRYQWTNSTNTSKNYYSFSYIRGPPLAV